MVILHPYIEEENLCCSFADNRTNTILFAFAIDQCGHRRLKFESTLSSTIHSINLIGVVEKWDLKEESDKMDPAKFKSRMGDLALGQALHAAARDYQKELLTEHSKSSTRVQDDLDLDDLMDDPELERLHAERIAALKKEAEKRQVLARKGHGEYREITEADFLGEVTGTERVVCHFFHKEFVRCKIMDKHLRPLAVTFFDTKFIRVDAENCPFFVTKLGIKVLPCVILFKNGVACDRIVGFEELGGKDDFSKASLEARLLRSGMIIKKEKPEADADEAPRRVRSTVYDENIVNRVPGWVISPCMRSESLQGWALAYLWTVEGNR
ncbi:hypothetical protein R1flu_026538 [Riccia fluitans]|uniref:Thioredoxin domain-containing protein n=1 Tax=Riccia fluitans TaxID=41844 RepID=A0ABD1XGA3_9MARC